MPYWFVSFSDSTKSEGERAQGVVLVRASREEEAILKASKIAQAAGVPLRAVFVYPLLSDSVEAEELRLDCWHSARDLEALGYKAF